METLINVKPRQAAVLNGRMNGQTNEEIGKTLGVSERSVRRLRKTPEFQGLESLCAQSILQKVVAAVERRSLEAVEVLAEGMNPVNPMPLRAACADRLLGRLEKLKKLLPAGATGDMPKGKLVVVGDLSNLTHEQLVEQLEAAHRGMPFVVGVVDNLSAEESNQRVHGEIVRELQIVHARECERDDYAPPTGSFVEVSEYGGASLVSTSDQS